MDYLAKNNTFKYRFDFEIGYLIESPCKTCDSRVNIPECMDDCTMLDAIHAILAEAVSCTSRK